MSTDSTKSYRSVDMIDAATMATAASFLEREWGDNRRLGYAGQVMHEDKVVSVFQCAASDGSRWLIWADRWGNRGEFTPEREVEVSIGLDVETHAHRA